MIKCIIGKIQQLDTKKYVQILLKWRKIMNINVSEHDNFVVVDFFVYIFCNCLVGVKYELTTDISDLNLCRLRER